MKKKILILNWRDPQNHLSGGAEYFTQKYAEHWVSLGHEVTWMTNICPNCKDEETINGVKYIRVAPYLSGKLISYLVNYPIYLAKTILVARKFIKRNQVDLVIDEIHGFPFFSPLFSSTKNIFLVCEVAGSIWDKMFPFPLNLIGKLTEKLIYSFYKNTEIWAISENTKKNILEILPQAEVKIIDLGVELNSKTINKLSKESKFNFPSAVFLARLVKMKGIETALKATSQMIKKLPNFKLFIIGSGDEQYVSFLTKKIHEMGIENNVEFLGRVDEETKFKYLAKVHFLLHPSYKEGFGLTLIEAGLVGTPAIIRAGSSMDSLINDGINGFSFSKEGQIAQIFLKNYKSKKYVNLTKQAKDKSREYLWDDVFKRSQEITGIK